MRYRIVSTDRVLKLTELDLHRMGVSAADQPAMLKQLSDDKKARSKAVLAAAEAATARGDQVQAAGELQAAADLGNAEAQLRLALAYLEGCGVGKNEAKAMQLFRQAAEELHRSLRT